MIKNDIFALDFGTTKFCIAALLFDANSSRGKVETISIPAQGMHRGMLADMEASTKALCHLVEAAESHLKRDIRRVIIGIAGSHLTCKKVLCEMPLNNKSVSASVIDLLTKMAEREVTSGRYILHAIPIEFKIDDREFTPNPIGLCGEKLTGRFLIIDGDEAYLKDMIRVCNKAGLEVTSLYAEPVASASVTVSEHQKQLGVAIADIGGGTTDGIVFRGGKPVDLFTINIAGMMMTKDLAIGLNTSFEEAEKIKRFFGIQRNTGETLLIQDIFGNTKTIASSDVYPILGARIIELVEHLVKGLVKYKGNFGAGLLLTGGGTEVKGLDQFIANQIKVSVNRAYPKFTVPTNPSESDNFASKYATAIGLLNLEIGRLLSEMSLRKAHWPRYYFGQFVNWIKEIS